MKPPIPVLKSIWSTYWKAITLGQNSVIFLQSGRGRRGERKRHISLQCLIFILLAQQGRMFRLRVRARISWNVISLSAVDSSKFYWHLRLPAERDKYTIPAEVNKWATVSTTPERNINALENFIFGGITIYGTTAQSLTEQEQLSRRRPSTVQKTSVNCPEDVHQLSRSSWWSNCPEDVRQLSRRRPSTVQIVLVE